MNIELSRKTVTKLMKIYNDLDTVHRKEFNQEDCSACVIAHALRHGIVTGKKVQPDSIESDTYSTLVADSFNDAVVWVGLPLIKEDLSTTLNVDHGDYSLFSPYSNYELGILGNYLFGNKCSIDTAAGVLGGNLPTMCNTPHQAKLRIAAVLKMGNYEVVWNS